jgi:hypothetical protein
MTQSKNPEKLRRRFLGIVYTRTTDKQGNPIPKQSLKFENAHLKAYLKGETHFKFGTRIDSRGQKEPVWHEVKQTYYYE